MKNNELVKAEASSKTLNICIKTLLSTFASKFTSADMRKINALPPRSGFTYAISLLHTTISKQPKSEARVAMPLIKSYNEMSPALMREIFDEFLFFKLKSAKRGSYSQPREDLFRELRDYCVDNYGMTKIKVRKGNTGFVAKFQSIARGAGRRHGGRFSLRPDSVMYYSEKDSKAVSI